ncbi:MAG TPA: PqqD family protein [Acidimicrobiales bacterium]|nr:PqqD family protein [Acidimicrobiales bacterium]
MRVTSSLPRRHPGVTRVDTGDAGVMRDAEGHDLCAVNETASALWDLCDGETTVEEMVDAVCQVCAVEPEQARRDIAAALRHLAAAGALDWAARP